MCSKNNAGTDEFCESTLTVPMGYLKYLCPKAKNSVDTVPTIKFGLIQSSMHNGKFSQWCNLRIT